MRLVKAHVTKYRSIRDSNPFDLESEKTILVGPNEAGKTALLRALQQLNPPADVKGFDALRDYPRAEYNDITTKKVDPTKVNVVEGHFALEDVDKAAVPEAFRNCTYVIGKRLDNTAWHRLDGGPAVATYASVKSDLARLVSYVDARVPTPPADKPAIHKPGAKLESVVAGWRDSTLISDTRATALKTWLSETLQYVEEGNKAEEDRHQRLMDACNEDAERTAVLETLWKRKPVFVLFSNYFRVRPLIHLEHLATRLEKNLLDDDQYDYGNKCLLKLLGFTARELSDLGKAAEPVANDQAALQKYRDQLDKRSYQLNAASVRLTNEIRNVWLPVADRGEADKLRVVADGQYLKVVVEDALGVEIELD